MQVVLRLLIAHLLVATPVIFARAQGQAPIKQGTIMRVLGDLSKSSRRDRLEGIDELKKLITMRRVDFLLNKAVADQLRAAGATPDLLSLILERGPDSELYARFKRHREGGDKQAACNEALEYISKFAGGDELRVREANEYLATNCDRPPPNPVSTPTPTPVDDSPARLERALREGDAALAANPPRYAQAAESYSAAKRLDLRDWRAYHKMGFLHASQGRHDDAIREFKEALARGADEAVVYRDLGIAYSEKGLYAEALDALQRPGVLVGLDAEVYRHLGKARYKLGHLAEAAEAYKKATAGASHDAEWDYEHGDIQLQLGRRDAALRSYRAALTLESQHVRAAEKIVTLRPNDPGAHHALGEIHLKLRKYAEAEKEFKKSYDLLVREKGVDKVREPEVLWHARVALRAGGEVVKVVGEVRLEEENGYRLDVDDFRGEVSVCVSDIHERPFEVFITKHDPNIKNCRQAPKIAGARLHKAQQYMDFEYDGRNYVLVMTKVKWGWSSGDYLEFMIFRKVS